MAREVVILPDSVRKVAQPLQRCPQVGDHDSFAAPPHAPSRALAPGLLWERQPLGMT